MTDDQLRELAKQLPFDRPEPARRDAVRSSLLVEANEVVRPAERRRWFVLGATFASGALVAAAIALLLRSPAPATPSASARITASSEAQLEHRFEGTQEVIQVRRGTVKLESAQRARVRTRDAEVDGSGVYEVAVVADALSAVSVKSGTAEIRITGQRPIFLATGQTWRVTIVTADLSPALPVETIPATPPVPSVVDEPAPPVATPDVRTTDVRTPDTQVRTTDTDSRTPDTGTPDTGTPDSRTPDTGTPDSRTPDTGTPDTGTPDTRTPDTGTPDTGTPDTRTPDVQPTDKPDVVPPGDTPSATPRGPTEIERRFKAGWALLRAGKAREAARELGAAADAAPQDPLAADARYFQAVAYVRAGEHLEAERVLVKFLDNAPKSLRRGRAAVLLGRLIGERGDVKSARAWLESAVGDPDPAIAAAARAGLEALAKPK